MIRTLALCLIFWTCGAVAGYYTALLWPKYPPPRVRLSYVEAHPVIPPCVKPRLSKRDERAVCAWEQVRKP